MSDSGMPGSPDVAPIAAAADRGRQSGPAELAFNQPTHAELGPEKVRSEKQKIKLRNYAFALAITVIVITTLMEIVILTCIVMDGNSSIHVAIVVAPIASFTTITIAVLIGVFRGFRRDDTSKMPLGTVVEASGIG